MLGLKLNLYAYRCNDPKFYSDYVNSIENDFELSKKYNFPFFFRGYSLVPVLF